MHLVQNPRLPTWSPATQMQLRKICQTDALQSLKLARKLQELARTFLYKSTYALMQWDKKTNSNLVISHNRHTVPQAKNKLS